MSVEIEQSLSNDPSFDSSIPLRKIEFVNTFKWRADFRQNDRNPLNNFFTENMVNFEFSVLFKTRRRTLIKP